MTRLQTTPRITVIMGVYNCAETLSEALDSLLCQTCNEWVAVLCDDGSSDRTFDIASDYVAKHPGRFILLKNENNIGLNATLNKCLEHANTEYIARMDGDDLSLPERFEKEIGFLDEHLEYSIVTTPMIYFDNQGEFRRGEGCGEPQLNDFPKGTPLCHATCMVRREAYEAVNGYSTSKTRLRVEDFDLWVRMYEKGFRGFVLDKPLYMMRDDRNARLRRKFTYRINETRVSASSVRKLGLPKSKYIWALRPIVVGLLPGPLYDYLHRKKRTK